MVLQPEAETKDFGKGIIIFNIILMISPPSIMKTTSDFWTLTKRYVLNRCFAHLVISSQSAIL